MQINKITSAVTRGTRKVGEAILNEKPEGAKLSQGLKKVNNFFQGESYNPGRGAYYALMSGCVIAPRLMKAREPDEFREILTRDVVTVLTILFAMKGLKSGMCTAAQKNAGIPLVRDTLGKNVSKLKRLGGYLNPEGGIIPLNSNEINSRYSRIFTKDEFVNTLKTVDSEGGEIGKMLSVETKEGFFGKLFPKKGKKTPLFDAAKKMFGDDFESKSNQEIIKMAENITADNKTALEGLEAVVGSKPFGQDVFDKSVAAGAKKAYDEAAKLSAEKGISSEKAAEAAQAAADAYKKSRADSIQTGILNGDKNPITYYARNIGANFETLSLAITAGFLGFGLPKVNEKLTMKKHLNKPGTNITRNAQPEGSCPVTGAGIIYNSIKDEEKSAFQAFMGNK